MADTDIELSVGLDASDVKQSARNLNKAIKEVFDGSVGAELNKNMQTLQQRMSQTASKAQALQEKMTQLESAQVPTQEYVELQKQIEKTEAQIAKMQEKWDRAQETGAPLQGRQLEQFRYDAAQLENTLEYAKEEMKDLVASGKAFTLGSDSAQYQKLTNDLASVNNQSRLLLVSWDSMVDKEESLSNATDKVSTSSTKLAKSWNETSNSIKKSNGRIKQFLSSLKMTVANLLTFGAASRSARSGISGMNRGFASGIKHMLRYALGISSLFVLFNKLRAAAMEGIKAFVLWEGENGRLNQSISSIMSSISTLKNNIGAMVAPLINALAPAITRIIDLLSVAIQKIAMFIAALTGQKTIMTANKVQENYAASLDKTAKSAKKAEKALKGYLSPLDEINKFQSDKEDEGAGGGAGAGAGAGFTEMPIDSKILDMIQKLKDMLAKLQPIIDYLKKSWDTFKKGFFDGLGDWKSRFEDIKKNLGIIQDALIDIFTDPRVLAAADRWFQSVMYLLGSLAGAALSIGLTIAQNLVGGIAKYLDENRERIKKHLISMFDIWADINEQLAEFAQAFAYVFEAFGGENGQRVTAALIGIFADAFMGVSELVSKSVRDVIQLITQPFIDNKEGLREALDGFLGVIATGLETIKEFVDDVVDAVNEGYDEYIKPLVDDMTEDISAFVGDVVDWWNTDVNPILQDIMDEVKKGYEQYIKPVIEQLKPLIGDLAELIRTVWENKVKPVFEFIKTYILPTITGVLKGIKDNVGDTMKYLGEQLQYFFDLLKGVIKFLTGVFSGDWEKAWEGIKDIFKAILNGIISTFERGLNKIVDGLNSISIDIPWDWAKEKLGTDKIGFDVDHVTLPRLAQGAVIPPNKEFLAMLGDQKSGTNIETPLETMVNAFNEALQQNGGGSQQIILNLMLPDKRTIAQYAIEGGQILQMSRGRNPFLLERG